MKDILAKSIRSWINHDPFTQSAAAAYYAIFSLPGLLIVTIGMAALFFDQQHVEAEVFAQISQILGQDVARSVDNIVDETQLKNRSTWAVIAGLATLIFGATGLFVQLQRSLNHIWEVEVKKSTGLIKFLKNRATSLGVVIAIGFLLLISLSLTTALTLLGEWMAMQVPAFFVQLILILNIGISLAVKTILFGLMFVILPDAKVEWRPAVLGGALSALLFNGGEYILNYYFEFAQPQSTFGAAGSLVLMMIWVSYSCMILLIGAEFAKAYAEKKNGCKAKASDIAKKKIKKD